MDYPNVDQFLKSGQAQNSLGACSKSKPSSSSHYSSSSKDWKDSKNYKDDYKDCRHDDYYYKDYDYKRGSSGKDYKYLADKKPVGPLTNEKKDA